MNITRITTRRSRNTDGARAFWTVAMVQGHFDYLIMVAAPQLNHYLLESHTNIAVSSMS